MNSAAVFSLITMIDIITDLDRKLVVDFLKTHRELRMEEFLLIKWIGKQEKVIMKEIANYLMIPFSTATSKVDRLVCTSYLKRGRDLKNRKEVMVSLTRTGLEMWSEFQEFRFNSLPGSIGIEPFNQLSKLYK